MIELLHRIRIQGMSSKAYVFKKYSILYISHPICIDKLVYLDIWNIICIENATFMDMSS